MRAVAQGIWEERLSTLPRRPVWLILLLILAAGAAFRATLALVTPPLYAPDEAGHVLYVHQIATHFSFPVQSLDGTWANRNGANEFYQPPLYYLLAAILYQLFAGWGVMALYALRLLNAALGVVDVYLIFRIAKLIFPDRPAVALSSAALVSLLPTAAGDSAAVNNDPFCYLLVALCTLLLLRSLRDGRAGLRLAVVVGCLTAAALYTRTSAFVLLPTIVLWGWFMRGRGVRSAWRDAAVSLGIALLAIAPWWLLRNQAWYGDFLGLDIGWHRYPDAPFRLVAKSVWYLGWSFWIAFGRTYDVGAEHVLAFLLSLVSIFLVWRAVRLWAEGRFTPLQGSMLALLSLEFVVALAAAVKFCLQFGFTQGRYLFPALPALAVAVGVAASSWKLSSRRLLVPVAVLAVMGAVSLTVLTRDLIPAFRTVVADTAVGGPMLDRHTGDYSTWITERVTPLR